MKARACAFVLALAFLLGGCNGSTVAPEPKDTFTPTEATDSPSTETTDAGPVEPTLPEAAKEATKAGAEAFLRYYWDVVNYAQATGDTKLLRTLDQPTCDMCGGGADWIDEVADAGGRIVGGGTRVSKVSARQSASGPTGWIVSATVSGDAARVVGAGKLNKRYPADDFDAVFVLTVTNGDWLISSWRPA